MLYLLGTEASPSTSVFVLTASNCTSLESSCPGVVAGKELGWPVFLHMVNTMEREIEGAR
jgi:UDP-N-acetylglucosamine:LPS N-acetylglucosamine transferase